MTKLLEGIRILDLTNVLAGPFCSYQLALLGAEVIKVEVPGTGDLARQLGADPALNASLMGVSFLAQNAGKKSVTLNLKSARGKSLFLDLVDRADVVLENFRPGVMDRLGVGYDALRARNPSILYCAISGFGQDGPMRRQPRLRPDHPGFFRRDERHRIGRRRHPCASVIPVADSIGGLTAAFASRRPWSGGARPAKASSSTFPCWNRSCDDGLGRLQLPDSRRHAGADGQREHDGAARRAPSGPVTDRSTSPPTSRSNSSRCAGCSVGRTCPATAASPSGRRARRTARP